MSSKFATFFKPGSGDLFSSSLLRNRTTSTPSSAAEATSPEAEATGRNRTRSADGVNPLLSAEPVGQEAERRRKARSSLGQTSSFNSGLGMDQLMERLDKATGRIHAFTQREDGKDGLVQKVMSQNPTVLLKVACICLAVGQWRALLTALHWLCSVFNLCTLIGIACVLIAANTYLVRAFHLLTANVIALTLAVPKLPRMAEEISEMLIQIKLMREDLQLMRSKVSWLPGGQ